MKRKRGNRKGKSRKPPSAAVDVASEDPALSEDASSEGDSLSSEGEDDNGAPEVGPGPGEAAKGERSCAAEKVAPPPERAAASVRPEGVVIERPPTTAVYGRVKVKLKASRPFFEAAIAVGAPKGGDIDKDKEKSIQKVGEDSKEKEEDKGKERERVVVVVGAGGGENEEGYGGNLVAESKGNGGIKVVSLKESSPLGVKEGSGAVGSTMEEEEEEEEGEEQKVPQRLRYDKRELEASLEVIKKVMKMDAAEPFNAPVDPIKLGIPDYFDVIDTPMDFGTIRSNLESGSKYMNSEDVYRDVQYIWDNCNKYNNKGDFIVDLMKRVKKNFMKYWMAAGLYTEQTKRTFGVESIPVDDATTSGHGKKLKRGKGVKRHKDDCMCAICIMKRRRREREVRQAQEAQETGAQATTPQKVVSKTGSSQEHKQEENLPAESPFGEETSSYLETSPDVDADAEMEDGEDARFNGVPPQSDDEQKAEGDRVEFHDKTDRSAEISEMSQQCDKMETEHSHAEAKLQDESGNRINIDVENQPSALSGSQATGHLPQRHEVIELEKKRQRLRLLETFRDLENPMLSGLCGMLFPNKPRSVWNGPNSLVHRQRQSRRSRVHEAVESLMTIYGKSTSS